MIRFLILIIFVFSPLTRAEPNAIVKNILSGEKASKEIGAFISERWHRQVWQIESKAVAGLPDPPPVWHVKGTTAWVRLEGPEHLREHLDLKKLNPANIYEIRGVPVDLNYGVLTFYILSIPEKADVSKPGAKAEQKAPAPGDLQGHIVSKPGSCRILYKDAEFEFGTSDYGRPGAPQEPALMVHDVRSDQWALLERVSTTGAKFGYIPMDKIMACPAPWDFSRLAQQEAVELPLGKGGVLHFPDCIEDEGNFYSISHNTNWKDDRVITVLRFDKEALRKLFSSPNH